MPSRTYSCLATPLRVVWKISAAARVMAATSRFCQEPRGYLAEEPKEDTPTLRMLRPMDTTTHADRMGEMILRQYLAVRPRMPSKTPPTMMAPTITP